MSPLLPLVPPSLPLPPPRLSPSNSAAQSLLALFCTWICLGLPGHKLHLGVRFPWTPPWPVDPSSPPWLHAPLGLLWSIIPLAQPWSVITLVVPWTSGSLAMPLPSTHSAPPGSSFTPAPQLSSLPSATPGLGPPGLQCHPGSSLPQLCLDLYLSQLHLSWSCSCLHPGSFSIGSAVGLHPEGFALGHSLALSSIVSSFGLPSVVPPL